MNTKTLFIIMDYLYDDVQLFPKLFEAAYLSKHKKEVVRKYSDFINRHPYYMQHIATKELMEERKRPKPTDNRTWQERVYDDVQKIQTLHNEMEDDLKAIKDMMFNLTN